MDEKETLEIRVQGKLSWRDYKRIASDRTPFEERAALIEKYITTDKGSLEDVDVPFGDVLGALQKLVNVSVPNSNAT